MYMKVTNTIYMVEEKIEFVYEGCKIAQLVNY